MKKILLFALAVIYLSAAPATLRAKPPLGTALMRLTYNVTPNAEWAPGENVVLSADARRNPEINEEDIFWRQRFTGTYPRTAGQTFDVAISEVRPGDKIIVQGYMCSENTSDCYPSDSDNPPSCSVEVHIRGNYEPKCQPVFTWTGGTASGGVICRAECL